jgi:hypothetical protein
MNCFEVRNDFVAFWQKTLAGDRQAQLLLHLRGCTACDRSFRTFALSAPVLYSAVEPELYSRPARPAVVDAAAFDLRTMQSVVERRSADPILNRVLPVFVMAAAAALVLYFAAPPQMTFEDAIATDNSSAEVTSYPSTDSLFGQELMAQSTTASDTVDE